MTGLSLNQAAVMHITPYIPYGHGIGNEAWSCVL